MRGTKMKAMGTPKPLASVARALTILEFLAQHSSEGVPLTFIAKSLDINKATIYNTLATLREYTWVEQDESSGLYRLGDGIAPLATYRTNTARIVEELHSALVAISHRFNELVHLGKLSGSHIIYLDKVEPDRPIRVVSKIGREAVAARTSLGRALIASLPESERHLERFLAEASISGAIPAVRREISASLEENIRKFPERGWTEEVEENEAGIACVAVPITLPSGGHMAVSISTPVERLPKEQRPIFARGIAEEILHLPKEAGFSVPETVLR